jgi:putative thiamine transport system permease protein
MLRFATPTITGILIVPILLGLIMAALPAFGILPALGGRSLTFDHWLELFAIPGIEHSLAVSLAAGLVTPLLSLAAVFLFLASTSGTALDRWIRRLVSPLLAIPHAAAAFGLAFLIAPSGFLARLVSPTLSGWDRPPDLLIVNDPSGLSLITGLIVKEIPFLLLMSFAALPQLDAPNRVIMARSLGYGPTLAYLKTVVPSLYPMLRLPVFAVIAYASSTVDMAIILGPTLPHTLSVMVLNWFSDPDLSHRYIAAAGAILQLGLSLAAIALWIGGEKIVAALFRAWLRQGQNAKGERVLWILGRGGVSLTALIAAASLLTLLLNSFSRTWRFPDSLPSDWSLQHWQRVLPDMGIPLFNTLIISVVATLLALLLVLAALEHEQRSQRRITSALWLLYIPLLLPQVSFLFGMVIMAESFHWQPGLALVMFAHLILVLPYVYLSLSEAYRRLDPRWSQVAATLGANPNRVFLRIRAALLLAPCLTAVAIGMAVSVGLFQPAQILGAGHVPTVTTEAVALASGGNRNIISVWAQVQALLPMLGFVLALGLPRLVWRNRQGMQELQTR